MPNLTYISPFFIVENLKASIAFYVDKLGFEVLYTGPNNGDQFYGMVYREKVSIMLKEIAPDIKPAPNHTHHQFARWDAYISTADPDVLFNEYQSRGVSFHQCLKVDDDNLWGFEVQDADGYILFFGRPES